MKRFTDMHTTLMMHMIYLLSFPYANEYYIGILPQVWEKRLQKIHKMVHLESWVNLFFQIIKIYYLSRVNLTGVVNILDGFSHELISKSFLNINHGHQNQQNQQNHQTRQPRKSVIYRSGNQATNNLLDSTQVNNNEEKNKDETTPLTTDPNSQVITFTAKKKKKVELDPKTILINTN